MITIYDANGREVAVTAAVHVPWRDVDARRLIEGAVITGRIDLDTEGGGRVHALRIDAPQLTGWREVAVYWCRFLRAMRVVDPSLVRERGGS